MISHLSCCAQHNAPALPAGPCDCGADSHISYYEDTDDGQNKPTQNLTVKQEQAYAWALLSFGPDSVHNKRERALRVLEEAIELAQACDVHCDEVVHLAEHVYDRSTGEISQEVGGLMMTLMIAAHSMGIDVYHAMKMELYRCIFIDPDKIKRKQQQKANAGIVTTAVPVAVFGEEEGDYDAGC